eukprot:2189111-Pyramimonas_sp.AAC.1
MADPGHLRVVTLRVAERACLFVVQELVVDAAVAADHLRAVAAPPDRGTGWGVEASPPGAQRARGT